MSKLIMLVLFCIPIVSFLCLYKYDIIGDGTFFMLYLLTCGTFLSFLMYGEKPPCP